MKEKAQKEIIVISLGGSMLVPGEIDTDFLEAFRALILNCIKNKRLIIVAGGGNTCRKYQRALKALGNNKAQDLDWLGIKSIMLNAELLRAIFGKNAYKVVIADYNKKVPFEKILIAGALKPGCTSDLDAVGLARTYGSKRVINFTNVPYVYDKNPKQFKDAHPLKKLTWRQYLDIIGKKFVPGMHSPFDPVAAKLAFKNKIKVEVLTGISNLSRAIDGKEFDGSTIM